MSTDLEPKPANKSGETQCIVRWFVETPAGWLGAWSREAFAGYRALAVAELADLLAESAATIRSFDPDITDDDDAMPGLLDRIDAAVRAVRMPGVDIDAVHRTRWRNLG